MAKSRGKDVSRLYTRAEVGTWSRCAYCDWNADSIDHVPALSILRKWGPEYFRHMGVDLTTYPSCRECNSVLSVAPVYTLAERCLILIGHYRVKYRRVLTLEVWTDAELRELGPTLRSAVVRLGAERDKARLRLKCLEN